MKYVIIMGASSGIGLELAKLYIKAGHRVGLAARRQERLEELRALAPERVEVARIDLERADALELLDDLSERLGGARSIYPQLGDRLAECCIGGKP